MILKQEITFFAGTLGLLPTTVEKDYVLSWVLYGISQHPQLSEWFFKGGTCLKKCYFETYRFSEDLDFTVPKGAIYSEPSIRTALDEVANFVYESVGVNLRTREIEVKESINKNGKKTYVAKYTYLGPLNLPSRTQQRIKFDITDDEMIVDRHDMREAQHLYSDAPSERAQIRCYSVNEILAEKTRAIYERQGRARDIYDVVNISRNFREHVDINIARTVLKNKFIFKGLPTPSVELILSRLDLAQLGASWKDQLSHQVEVLPPVESFYNDLNTALSWWIDEEPIELILKTISHTNEAVIQPRIYFPRVERTQANKYIDQIQYAARNRLCVEIEYHNYKRLVEPYSLRLPDTGNQLLYVYELTKSGDSANSIKSYNVNEITNAVVKQQAFVPRYKVEL